MIDSYSQDIPSRQVEVIKQPPVTIDTSALATSAKQDTIIGHIDGVESLLTTIDADTGVLAGAVTLGKVQTEVTNTVPVSGTFWQATQPVSGTVTASAQPGVDIGDVTINNGAGANAVNIQDGGNTITVDGSVTVSATDLDVRNLAKAQDEVYAVLRTDAGVAYDARLVTAQANSGVDIGDVTINNAAGASAVNIQDGGNSLTVDAPVGTPVFVRLSDGASAISTLPVSMATQTPTLATRTSGGLTTYHLVSAATTNATVVKASAGQLYGWYIYNSNAAARKVAFHNTASTPTAGASIYFTLMIPPSSGANVFSDIGMPFSSGIAITTVTGLADSDSAAVAANDLVINLWYA